MKSTLPKVLHPLLGRTLLGHAMHAVMGLAPEEVVVVVRHDRDQVAAEAVANDPTVVVADQDDVPGTGRAVWCALQGAEAAGRPLSGTVLVTSADVPLLETETLRSLVKKHEDAGAAVTLVSTIARDPEGYGRVIRKDPVDPSSPVEAIVEHRDATEAQRAVAEINAGIYAFDSGFLAQALGDLDQNNDQGEVYLTDAVAVAVRRGLLAQAFVLEDGWQAEGCNDRWQLAALRKELNRRICKRHALAGVTVVDPDNTSVDVQVVIGQDAVINPFTSLVGDTKVGSFAVVGPGSTVIDSTVGSGALVPSSFLSEAQVDAKTQLSPFTVVSGGRADQL